MVRSQYIPFFPSSIRYHCWSSMPQWTIVNRMVCSFYFPFNLRIKIFNGFQKPQRNLNSTTNEEENHWWSQSAKGENCKRHYTQLHALVNFRWGRVRAGSGRTRAESDKKRLTDQHFAGAVLWQIWNVRTFSFYTRNSGFFFRCAAELCLLHWNWNYGLLRSHIAIVHAVVLWNTKSPCKN